MKRAIRRVVKRLARLQFNPTSIATPPSIMGQRKRLLGPATKMAVPGASSAGVVATVATGATVVVVVVAKIAVASVAPSEGAVASP